MSSGSYLVYGRRPVEELLKRQDLRALAVMEIWVMDGLPTRISDPLHREFRDRMHIVPRREIDRRYPDINHQGVVVKLKSSEGLHTESQTTWQDALTSSGGLYVALHDVQDPQNVGSIIRTAEALGVTNLFLCGQCAPLSPVVDRASSGASLHVSCYAVANVNVLIREAKEKGIWVLATVPPDTAAAEDGVPVSTEPKSGARTGIIETTDLERIPPARDSLLILGSEGRGLGRHTIANADVLLTIPLYGRTASLNAAAAAAILIDRLINR
ncbi:MAG: RNA methyltransferase [Spirochaetia bacterium]|nr:RNA methyltransferase [Spirochaetia bacterium]